MARPKGSKNKPKDELLTTADNDEFNNDHLDNGGDEQADEKMAAVNSHSNTVILIANMPLHQSYRINGKEYVINGCPVNKLLIDPNTGQHFQGGKWGITPNFPRDVWEEIKRVYGKHCLIEKGFIREANSKEDAKAIAKENVDMRHGLEPIEKTVGKPDQFSTAEVPANERQNSGRTF